MDKSNKIILVTGATGHQGGAVIRYLLKDGWEIRALTRDLNQPAVKELMERGIDVVQGDLDDPVSIDKAVMGAYGVFSVQQPWEHGVDSEMKQGIALADAAKKAGVRHFVYSSVGSADERTGIPHFESKFRIEEHIRNLRMDFTIVRPVWFMDNLLSPDMRDSIYNGVLPLALNPEVSLQMIAVDDIGAFVAMVFDNPEQWIGRAVDIAGDELTGPEMAEILSRALGREVRFKEIAIEEVRNYSSDAAMMFDWFNLRGYSADISAMRTLMPVLMTFDTWVSGAGWHKAAA